MSQAVEGTPRRFDVGLIEKLEECLSVTSRNCCLYHFADPLIGNLGQTGCFRAGRTTNRRANVALAGGKCQYRRAEAAALGGLNDTTADHVVTAVQNRGLPGTERPLW